MNDHRIAVIGMSARMPGADSVEEFWQRALAGTVDVHRFTEAELRGAGLSPDLRAAAAGLGDISAFDASFFGLSAERAARTDPQHRIFYEVAHHALEDAGYAAGGPSRTGVYAGAGYDVYPLHGYLRHQLAEVAEEAAADRASSLELAADNASGFLAAQTAALLGLSGPAVGVQTGASTGLTAVRLAVTALLNGEADLAIAGASAVHVPQVLGYLPDKGYGLSPTGTCRAFDAASDGTVVGNGVAAVVLKRLDEALADGDRVHAVILGAATSVRRALAAADVTAEDLGYLEAHGTGSAEDDRAEFAALSAALREHSSATGFCALGSAKPAIGHLDAAAGLAGFVRAVCAVRSGVIPPLANHTEADPALSLADSPFRIPTEAADWPDVVGPRIAGVNAVGPGGADVHVIVAQPPDLRHGSTFATSAPSMPGLLPVSAEHPEALRDLAGAYAARLRQSPVPRLADVVATAALGRRRSRHRLVAYGDSPAALADALDSYLSGTRSEYYSAYQASDSVHPLFAYSGLAEPGPTATKALYDRCAHFSDVLDEASARHQKLSGIPLIPALLGDSEPAPTVAMPAQFAAQAGMSVLWRHLGVRPTLVLGHGAGELAALHAVGAMTLADGIRLAAGFAELVERETPPGGMVAILADKATVDTVMAACPGITLAVVNGPENHVLAGSAGVVDKACRLAKALDLRWQRLPVKRGYHSAQLDGVSASLRALAATVEWRPTTVPFLSGLDGTLHPAGWLPGADYVVEQALSPVRFDTVLEHVASVEGAILLELGPQPALTRLARNAIPGLPTIPSGREDAEVDPFHRAIGELHCAGVTIDWAAIVDETDGRRIDLPLYPFRRERHWAGTAAPAPVPTVPNAPSTGDNVMPGTPVGLTEEPASPSREAAVIGPTSPPVEAVVGELAPASEGGGGGHRALAEAIQMAAEAAASAARAAEHLAVQIPRGPSGAHRETSTPEFGLCFLGHHADGITRGYGFLRAAAEFADANDFAAIWLPGRQAAPEAGPFPSTVVLAAALAADTTSVRLHATDVVLPAQDTVRLAEEWSMVDSLSGGRVALTLGADGPPADFTPDTYPTRHDTLDARVEELRAFWQGAALRRRVGDGSEVDIHLHPRPVQERAPLHLSASTAADFTRAARLNLPVVTNLIAQDLDTLRANLSTYRAECADPHVTVLLHTHVAAELGTARREAYAPLARHMRSTPSLFEQLMESLDLPPEGDPERAFQRVYDHFCETRALIGGVDSVRGLVDELSGIGVDEIAAIVDFGVEADRVRVGLGLLAEVRAGYVGGSARGHGQGRGRGVRPRVADGGVSGAAGSVSAASASASSSDDGDTRARRRADGGAAAVGGRRGGAIEVGGSGSADARGRDGADSGRMAEPSARVAARGEEAAKAERVGRVAGSDDGAEAPVRSVGVAPEAGESSGSGIFGRARSGRPRPDMTDEAGASEVAVASGNGWTGPSLPGGPPSTDKSTVSSAAGQAAREEAVDNRPVVDSSDDASGHGSTARPGQDQASGHTFAASPGRDDVSARAMPGRDDASADAVVSGRNAASADADGSGGDEDTAAPASGRGDLTVESRRSGRAVVGEQPVRRERDAAADQANATERAARPGRAAADEQAVQRENTAADGQGVRPGRDAVGEWGRPEAPEAPTRGRDTVRPAASARPHIDVADEAGSAKVAAASGSEWAEPSLPGGPPSDYKSTALSVGGQTAREEAVDNRPVVDNSDDTAGHGDTARTGQGTAPGQDTALGQGTAPGRDIAPSQNTAPGQGNASRPGQETASDQGNVARTSMDATPGQGNATRIGPDATPNYSNAARTGQGAASGHGNAPQPGQDATPAHGNTSRPGQADQPGQPDQPLQTEQSQQPEEPGHTFAAAPGLGRPTDRPARTGRAATTAATTAAPVEQAPPPEQPPAGQPSTQPGRQAPNEQPDTARNQAAHNTETPAPRSHDAIPALPKRPAADSAAESAIAAAVFEPPADDSAPSLMQPITVGEGRATGPQRRAVEETASEGDADVAALAAPQGPFAPPAAAAETPTPAAQPDVPQHPQAPAPPPAAAHGTFGPAYGTAPHDPVQPSPVQHGQVVPVGPTAPAARPDASAPAEAPAAPQTPQPEPEPPAAPPRPPVPQQRRPEPSAPEPTTAPIPLPADGNTAPPADPAYWSRVLAPPLPVVAMPADRLRTAALHGTRASEDTLLAPKLAAALRAIGAEAAQATQAQPQAPNRDAIVPLIAGVVATVRRFSGQDDLIVGVPGGLPLRVDLSGDPAFGEVLVRVAAGLRELARHAGAAPDGTTFQVAVGFSAPSVEVAWEFVDQGDGIVCRVGYAAEVFDAQSARRFGRYLRDILTAATEDPAQRLSQLDDLSDDDMGALDHWHRGPQVDPVGATVDELFAGFAARTPQAVAAACGRDSLSYSTLDALANQLAHQLRSMGVGPSDVVGVLMPQDLRLVVTLVAVVKAGAAYLPLDPASGAEGVARILADSRAKLTVVEQGLAGLLPEGAARLHPSPAELDTFPSTSPEHVTTPDSPCYVLYDPRRRGPGVVVAHRSLANLCGWFRRRFRVGAEDRIAAVAGPGTDASVLEIWPALTSGAAIVMGGEDVPRDGDVLAEWFGFARTTIAVLPTGPGETMIGLPAESQPQSLRALIVGGDPLYRRPSAELPYEVVNAYGPTEATVMVTSHTATPGGTGGVPIGTPIDNTRFYVLDGAGRPLPVGVPGELYIAGDCLASGYLNAASLTAQHFPVDGAGQRYYRTGDLARWNNEGVLEYYGRVADQVPLGGHKVDPAAVAGVLRTRPGIADAAVLALRGPDGAPYLAAFLVLEEGAAPSGLEALFPAYVAPKTWTVLDGLPRDASGAHDFTALLAHAPALSTGDAESPRIEGEKSPQDPANPPAFEPPPVDKPVDEVLDGPLNNVQRGMTGFFAQFGTALNIPVQVDLSGPLDTGALKDAFTALTVRHHSLRSRFAEQDGEWFQEVLDDPDARLKLLDLTALAEDQRAARADAHAEEARAEAFDLAEGHVWRGVLIRLSEQDWRLVLVFHHVLVDDWARALFLTELAELYNAAVERRPARLTKATQAIAHALAEPEPDLDRRLTYWTDRLDGVPLGLDLPYDRPGGRDRKRATQELVLPSTVVDAAAELGERQETGPFAVYAAALGVFLSRLAGTENLFLRTHCVLRDEVSAETVMASMSLSGALELDLTGEGLDFAGLVARTGDDHADGSAHHVTFPRLLEALSDRQVGGVGGDVVQFLFPGSTVSALHFNGVEASFTAEPIHMVPGTIFMCVPAAEGWRLVLQYSPGELDEATAAGWLDTWATVLEQLCADPDTPIGDL